jgi:hypothetical protein
LYLLVTLEVSTFENIFEDTNDEEYNSDDRYDPRMGEHIDEEDLEEEEEEVGLKYCVLF